MIDLGNFKKLVEVLKGDNSRIAKEKALKDYDTEANRALLWFIFNPYVVTGISSKKAEKYKGKLKLGKFSLLDLVEENNTDYTDLTNMFNYFKEHNTGRDEDLMELEKYAQYNAPYQDLIYSIITKDLKLGITSTTLNKVYGKGFIPSFDVMLAEKYFDDPEGLVPNGTEFVLTTKLDGVRCLILNTEEGPELFSRQGQPLKGFVEIERDMKQLPKGYAYDGELLFENINNLDSKDLYRATMKEVTADKEKHNVIFNCFDILPIEDFKKGKCSIKAKDRKEMLHKCLSLFGNIIYSIKEVKCLYKGTDKSQINYWLDKITSEGGEGVMINIADAPYECKRTKNLLKVKKFQSCDLLVYDLEEGEGQNKGKLGAAKVWFIAPDGNKYSCDVGCGFTLEQREDFWQHKEKLLNRIIEVGYFEITQNQQGGYGLRFPTFKWVREDKSEISMY